MSTERHERPERPPGHKLPQIIVEGVLRHSVKSDVITFSLSLLRLVELHFIVTVPSAGMNRAPVYIRFWLDPSKQDRPGSVVIE